MRRLAWVLFLLGTWPGVTPGQTQWGETVRMRTAGQPDRILMIVKTERMPDGHVYVSVKDTITGQNYTLVDPAFATMAKANDRPHTAPPQAPAGSVPGPIEHSNPATPVPTAVRPTLVEPPMAPRSTRPPFASASLVDAAPAALRRRVPPKPGTSVPVSSPRPTGTAVPLTPFTVPPPPEAVAATPTAAPAPPAPPPNTPTVPDRIVPTPISRDIAIPDQSPFANSHSTPAPPSAAPVTTITTPLTPSPALLPVPPASPPVQAVSMAPVETIRPYVQSSVMAATTRMGAEPPEVRMHREIAPWVAELTRAVRPSVRMEAATALAEGRYGWRDEVKTYLAKAAATDPAAVVRAHCISLLTTLGYAEPEWRSFLAASSSDKNPDVRVAASIALARLEPR